MGFNDVAVGTEMVRTLGIKSYEINDPVMQMKMKDIAQFLNDHPDPLFLMDSLRRSNRSPHMSNVDHVLSYIQLSRKKGGLMKEMEELDRQLKNYQ